MVIWSIARYLALHEGLFGSTSPVNDVADCLKDRKLSEQRRSGQGCVAGTPSDLLIGNSRGSNEDDCVPVHMQGMTVHGLDSTHSGRKHSMA